MQEAMAHYASNNPLQAQTYYLDTVDGGGFGSNIIKQVPGWDCPAYATFLDSPKFFDALWAPNGTICVFERDLGYPLSRHSSDARDFVSVNKNIALVVRAISTNGNYDLMFDYQFYYDGSIEVTVRFSGYIMGAHYAGNEEYGYRIHDALSGAMHDHVVNFKLDLDVKGTANTLQRTDIKPVTTSFTGSQQQLNTMKLERTFIKNENQGKLNWAPNSESMYVVLNKNSTNKYGEMRG
jgi:primary-amine oxidase